MIYRFSSMTICLSLAVPMFVFCQELPEPRSILRKAIAAHGGEKNISKPRMGILKANGRIPGASNGDSEISQEETFDLPKRWKRVTVGSFEGEKLVGFNLMIDGKFWEWEEGTEATEVRQTKRRSHYFGIATELLELMEDKVKLSGPEEIKVSGQPAIGFRATRDGETVDYYFNKTSGLLAQVVFKWRWEGKESDAKTLYAEYKKVDGVQLPFRVTGYKRGSSEDWVQMADASITEVKIVDKIPEVFSLPQVPRISADELAELIKKDLKSLEGIWEAVYGKLDGKESPPPKGSVQMILEGNKFTWKTDGKVKDEGTFVIDPTKKRKTMDFMCALGEEKGKTRPGIYLLKDQELLLCVASPGETRPESFTCEIGDRRFLVVLKRVQP